MQYVSFNPAASAGAKFSADVIAEIAEVAPATEGSTVTWDNVTSKPAVIAAGVDAAAARTAIGTGGLTVANTWTTTQTLSIAGIQNFRTPPTQQTAAVTLTTASSTVQVCTATTAAFAVTLPATTISGIRFVIKKVDSSANAVTVSGTSIDGASTYVLSTQYQWVEVMSTSTSGTWLIVGKG